MYIINGLLYEEDISPEAKREDLIEFVDLLGSSLTTDIASDISIYLKKSNNNPDSEIGKIIKDKLSSKLSTFSYMNSLRNSQVNTHINEFNFFDTLDMYDKGLFLGYKIGTEKVLGDKDIIAVAKDIISMRQYIAAYDSQPSKETFDQIAVVAKAILTTEGYRSFMINHSRIYSPKRKDESTFLGGVIRKVEQIEMALKGIEYQDYLSGKSNVLGEGTFF